ncbi:unnamed protein product [Auanema sp. JU1783]|nr:unnamed protein product [Auanema sp. JU1783]
MAKLHAVEKTGPQPPGTLPEGDKGWDWDEHGAPGSVPEDHYIQTTFIHRSNTESDKAYANNIRNIIKDIQERLKKEARVTIDNENIECKTGEENHRCADYPSQRAYHFLVVEDSSKGAAVYSLDKKYNEKEIGSIEMALLDAFSRHSPNPLTIFASKIAEPHVGFVRELSAKEIAAMARTSSPEQISKHSSLELQLIEPTLIELRHGEGLDTIAHKLIEFQNQKQFDEALKTHQHVFVLFWSNVFSLSLHQFNLWARTSNVFSEKNVLLAHVRCHENINFCDGLKTADFNTIVAYRDGVNTGTTQHLSNIKYYQQWIRLMINSPFVELKTEGDLKSAKKGVLPDIEDEFSAVTIGIFPESTGTAFRHFEIAAEKLKGRYAVALFVKPGAEPSVASYRPKEKKKRLDYEGRYDPASLISFISNSQLPSVIDIVNGFTTDALFRQNRIVICLLSVGSTDSTEFEKLAARDELRKNYIFTKISKTDLLAVDDVLDRLFLDKRDVSTVILFDKDRVFFLQLHKETSDDILAWAQQSHQKEPELELSPKDVHPLRLLQVGQVNDLFGKQNTVLLPDHTLFKDLPPAHPQINFQSGGTGGCPFMAGGGAAHDEL